MPQPTKITGLTWYRSLKASAEFCTALFLFILAAPVILLAALLVKLSSIGPEFYSQTRLGRNGRAYRIFKLRTMRHNCEKHSGPCWSSIDDPRVTKIGHFLRQTHIDELPQLWNVVRGEMSLVGPRPERPEFIPRLEEKLPLYRCRLLVRPGVTGLAQVRLPPDTDLASVRRKLAYDLYYVRHANPWLDLKILLATVLHVVGVPYDFVSRFVSLPSDQAVEAAYCALLTEHPATPAGFSLPSVEGSAEVAGVEMVTASA